MKFTYKLILKSGPNAGTEFPLEKDELFLGRDASNDIVINDPEVSRRHARLVKQGDDYFYEDLRSTNGSFIQGLKLSTLTMLKPDTKITIGEKVELLFNMTSTDTSATVVSPRKQTVPSAERPISPPPTPLTPPVYVVPPQAPGMATPPPVKPSGMSKGVKTLLIVIAAIIILCVIPSLIMETTNTWCALLGWLFNILQPGSCPM